jgi:hypothetical protein
MIASFLAAMSALVLVGFVLFPIVWLYAIYDAYTVAEARVATIEGDGPNAGA